MITKQHPNNYCTIHQLLMSPVRVCLQKGDFNSTADSICSLHATIIYQIIHDTKGYERSVAQTLEYRFKPGNVHFICRRCWNDTNFYNLEA